MKINILFFSGTGNTWWCARRMAEEFAGMGHDAEEYSLETLTRKRTEEIVKESDLLGLGYPVYGSDLPLPMKEFIEDFLPDLRTEGRPGEEGTISGKALQPYKRIFVFCTQLMFSGDGARIYQEALKDKGYETGWSVHLNMPNNICVTVLPIPYTNDPKRIGKRLSRTEKRIKQFVSAILSGRNFAQGKGWFPKVLGSLQRNPYRRFFDSLRNDISIDYGICTGCGRCVEICPERNLVWRDGKVIPQGSCVLCVRCYNFCPVQAILYMGKYHKASRGIPYRGPGKGFSPEGMKGRDGPVT